jgi:far upstream element-binding protein
VSNVLSKETSIKRPFIIGSKRSHQDDQDAYHPQQRSYDQDERSSKRSAYDGGSSRPSRNKAILKYKTTALTELFYIDASEPRRYGLGSEERRGNGNGECNVPNNMVGLIIGKNGDNLKKIERVSGAKVQFSDGKHLVYTFFFFFFFFFFFY